MKKKIANLLQDIWLHLKQNWWAAVVGVVLSVGVGWTLYWTALGQKLIFRSYDLPYAFRPPIPVNEVVLVYMDETSYNVLQQPYNASWHRGLHADLLRKLKADGAKSVTFDIVFSDPFPDAAQGPQIDKDFADAIREHGRIVLAFDNVPAALGMGQKASQRVEPYEPLKEAAAAIGSAEMAPDDDLVIRQHLLESPKDDHFTLSWTTAELLQAKITEDPIEHFKTRWVNYYGPHGTIPSVSYYQVIQDITEPETLTTGFFSNKVVFVGANTFTKFAFERKDAYPAPFPNQEQENKFMPGVEVQATIFLNLLREDWLNRLPQSAENKIITLLGIFLGAGLIFLRPWMTALTAVLTGTAVTFGNYYFFTRHHYWFPWMILVIGQIPIAMAWSISYNSIRLYVANQLLEQSLGKYVSPKRVKQMINRKEVLAPGAEKQMLTILFSDIENFTVLSEGVDSGELAKLMNNYFESAVTDCVFKTDGTVVKYIGDAIFSFWNAPEDQTDHQVRACEAGLLLSYQAITFEKNGVSHRYRTRVGLHTGFANVGNFGSATRIDYTAIGENINLASRMEGLNKYLGTSVLITGDTKVGVLEDRLVMRFCGRFILKGFEKAVEVYEIVGKPDSADASKAWRDAFAEALTRFQKGHFENAEAGFQCVLEIKPDDGPAKFYLKELKELRAHPLNPDWDGEIELKEK